MLKKNVDKIETMMQEYLTYRYGIYLRFQKEYPTGTISPDFTYYNGACSTIEACGGTWQRNFKGGDENDIQNYSHTVILPDDETCKRLNEHAWL